MAYQESELGKLLADIRRPFQTGGNRDFLWDSRRDTVNRRNKPWIPPTLEKLLGPDYQDRFPYRDTKPRNQVNRLTQRQGANDIQIEVRARGDAGPVLQRKVEDREDWFRGARETLDPVGRMDQRARRYMSQDGLAWFELEFAPSFQRPTMDDGEDGAGYIKRIDMAKREYGLPVCLNAPDGRGIYYASPDLMQPLTVVAKVVEVQLIDIQNKWLAEGFQIRMGDEGRLYQDDVLQVGEAAPSPSAAEIGKRCRFVLIADSSYIYHAVYPNAMMAGQTWDDSPDSPPTLVMLAKYKNPLGRPPFYPMPAILTGDPDPAYATMPLAADIIDQAPMLNSIRTARHVRMWVEAMAPWFMKNNLPDGENDNPRQMPDWVPGLVEMPPGLDFANAPHNPVPDFDKFDAQITEVYAAEDRTLSGAAQAGVIGRSTPAWTVQQFNEEQAGFFIEPLTARATGWREVLTDVAKLCRESAQDSGPVYVNAQRASKKEPANGHYDTKLGLGEHDLDPSKYVLSVTIEAQTQSQRAANTEYGRRLRQDGVLSRESYIEDYTPIPDHIQEQRRIDREAMVEPMRPAAIQLGKMMASQDLINAGYPPDLVQAVFGPPPGAPQPGVDTGNAPLERAANIGNPVMPGQGMDIEGPDLDDYQQPQQMAPLSGG